MAKEVEHKIDEFVEAFKCLAIKNILFVDCVVSLLILYQIFTLNVLVKLKTELLLILM